MSASFEAFPTVHGFYLPEDALHKDFTGLGSFANCHQGFVEFFGPLEVRMDDVFVLIEGSTDHKEAEESEKQLTPLSFIEDAESFAIFHNQALSELIADLDLLIIIRHHLRDVTLPYDFYITSSLPSFSS